MMTHDVDASTRSASECHFLIYEATAAGGRGGALAVDHAEKSSVTRRNFPHAIISLQGEAPPPPLNSHSQLQRVSSASGPRSAAAPARWVPDGIEARSRLFTRHSAHSDSSQGFTASSRDTLGRRPAALTLPVN